MCSAARLQEVCDVMDCSLPAVKAALHRGRTQLREIADEPDDAAAAETVGGRSRAARRLCRAFQRARFRRHPRHDRRRRQARSRQQDPDERQGRSVTLLRQLFDKASDWHLVPGLVEGRPAILVFDPERARCGAEIFHAAATGRPARSPPSAISATRLTSSMAR